MRSLKNLKFTFATLLLTACSQNGSRLMDSAPQSPEVVKEAPQVPDDSIPENPPSSPKTDPDLGLCSSLDLSEVKWPTNLSVSEWTYYALGLNITGSFEGHQGWTNITGNFDGQGLSLGLMQQNLGQGSLQPWLIEMFKQYNSILFDYFSNADYKDLKSMLEKWQNGSISLSSQALPNEKSNFFLEKIPNKLDIGFVEPELTQLGSSTDSVQWAKSHILDSKGNVTARWKKSFQDMAGSYGYRTFQLAASTSIFLKAKAYFDLFKFRELRFLLFFFDIVVQNGGLYAENVTEYENWLRNNSQATEQSRALKLLEIRLKNVKNQYKEDVRSRKSAIIYGIGKVHQTNRDFAKEFCFDPRALVQ
jgi:hypothetical protein